ncbi:MAG: PIG-L family deacetylase [Cycloclasticus sp.]
MSKKLNKGFKQKKRQALIRLLLAAVLAAYLVFSGQFALLLAFLMVLFIANELFFADHNFYEPGSDYLYSFDSSETLAAEWSTDGAQLKPTWAAAECDTALLAIEVRHQWLGKLLDPFVTLSSAGIERQQYFERSVNGLRYINISEFIHTAEPITIKGCRCQLTIENSQVLLFVNPSLDNKKILVLAPHADDAEIAAFGLYSTNNSAIVTLTAGEVDAKVYESTHTSAQQASLLKGRLRAWDSMAVPQWAGLRSDDVIQLGYFCLRLKAMHEAPNELIASKTAGVDDTRVFREFNRQTLATDQHGQSNWLSLIADLVECIERIKPDIIVTPHLQLDPHEDHRYTSLALRQALMQSSHQPNDIYFYANHLVSSDIFPFGPEHSLASLVPNVDETLSLGSVVSVPLSMDTQKNKAASLAMMHDLQTPLRWKKRLRFKLQSWFIGRPLSPYGDDEFFRKAVRSNEVFYRQSRNDFMQKTLVKDV